MIPVNFLHTLPPSWVAFSSLLVLLPACLLHALVVWGRTRQHAGLRARFLPYALLHAAGAPAELFTPRGRRRVRCEVIRTADTLVILPNGTRLGFRDALRPIVHRGPVAVDAKGRLAVRERFGFSHRDIRVELPEVEQWVAGGLLPGAR